MKSDTDAAIELMGRGVQHANEPATWHGGLSYASLILLPFNISAREFVQANIPVRNLVVDELLRLEKQRVIRALTLCLVVAIAFLLLPDPKWRVVACGGVAMKAGIDLGRFVARRRTLERARTLAKEHLEQQKPAETSV